jgi:hypothetical protein
MCLRSERISRRIADKTGVGFSGGKGSFSSNISGSGRIPSSCAK